MRKCSCKYPNVCYQWQALSVHLYILYAKKILNEWNTSDAETVRDLCVPDIHCGVVCFELMELCAISSGIIDASLCKIFTSNYNEQPYVRECHIYKW